MTDEKKAPQKEPAQAPKAEGEKSHHKKIAQMNLAEVQKALEAAKEHMGGFLSNYAKTLLERKNILSKGGK